MADLKDFLPYTSTAGQRGTLTIATTPPEGIPSDNQEWVMIGLVDDGAVGAPDPNAFNVNEVPVVAVNRTNKRRG